MNRMFFTADEVAALLGITKQRLQKHGSKSRVFKPTANLRYYVRHVAIIERVWMGAITAEIGEAELTMLIERARMGSLPQDEAV